VKFGAVLRQEVHRRQLGRLDRVVAGEVVLRLRERRVVQVDRADARRLARRVRDRHVRVEDEPELDDAEQDDEQRHQDERELDQALATGWVLGSGVTSGPNEAHAKRPTSKVVCRECRVVASERV
jgi:hypothetical protein